MLLKSAKPKGLKGKSVPWVFFFDFATLHERKERSDLPSNFVREDGTMSSKTESAAIRYIPLQDGARLRLIHRGRKAKQTVGQPVRVTRSHQNIREGVLHLNDVAHEKLRFPEEVQS